MFVSMFYVSVTVLKKAKHRIVETMNTNTADALGLSRAILCNGRSTSRDDCNTVLSASLFCRTNNHFAVSVCPSVHISR